MRLLSPLLLLRLLLALLVLLVLRLVLLAPRLLWLVKLEWHVSLLVKLTPLQFPLLGQKLLLLPPPLPSASHRPPGLHQWTKRGLQPRRQLGQLPW